MTDEQKLPTEVQKWIREQNKRDAERVHDSEKEFLHKANDAAVSTGSMALRTAVLINGGAAISMLTFIGGLVANSKLAVGAPMAEVTLPLIWFAIGVALATASMGFGYIANYSNAGIISSRSKTWVYPYVSETAATKRWRCVSVVFTVLSILGALASLVCFVYGMFAIRIALSVMRLL